LDTTLKRTDIGKYFRLFTVLLFIEVVLEIFGYQFMGKLIFGAVWSSDMRMERIVHLVWLLVITTPLLYGVVVRYLRRERAFTNEIWRLAHYDDLTGLCNRRQLTRQLSNILKDANQSNQKFAVLFIDLDRFKHINDSLGHDIGDEVLKVISKRISGSVRHGDVVARFGGDEFVTLMPSIDQSGDAIQVAQRILERVQEKISFEGYEFYLTASIGIAVYPVSGDSATSILKSADTAMYEAKRLGKNRWYVHMPSMQEQMYSRFQLENDLRRAIKENLELYLEYQPQIDVDTAQIVGAEALVRWNHPLIGIISPSEFIPLAEEAGIIVDLGKFVLKSVCHQIKEWETVGSHPVPIGINVSQIELAQLNFVSEFTSVLSEWGVESSRICIEITETTLMKDEEQVREKLRQLKNYGIRVMIDDFGKGYNSLGVLRQLPVDVMKIDSVFIRDIHTSLTDKSILSALVMLAHANDLDVLAEGVEHIDQLSVLQQESCDEYQGFLFSPPVSAEKFAADYL
jgi:diguanylate cyclase (GGDEF)-like protein